MGQLVLGLAGAAIGFFIGGGPMGAAIGWSLGSLAGSLLFPAQQQGPRLNDTKVQGAEYGTCRPKVYGMMRVGGIGMGQGSIVNGPNQFTEVQQKSGGKGGPATTNLTYLLSFFNEMCEGVILGVRRRWSNNRLINNAGSTPAPNLWPETIYTGSASQMPDPTMETIYGVGEVTPMRGVAYAAMEEHDVTNERSRPNVEYEVYTSAGPFPTRINTFLPPRGAGSTESASILNGITTVGVYTAVPGSPLSEYYQKRYDINGVFIDQPINRVDVPNPLLAPGVTFVGCANYPSYAVGVQQAAGPTGVSAWYYNGDIVNYPVYGAAAGEDYYSITVPPFYYNGYLYGLGNINGSSPYVGRWPINQNTNAPDSLGDASYTFSTITWSSDLSVMVDDAGFVWVGGTTDAGLNQRLFKFDGDLNLIHAWTVNTLPAPWLAVLQFTVYNNQLAFVGVDPITGFTGVLVYSIDGYTGFTRVGVPLICLGGPLIYLGGGLALTRNGVISLIPPPGSVILGDIVSDILRRPGAQMQPLTLGQVDMSDLTQEVFGFLLASQMTKFNAIAVLRQGYFFDVTEFDGKLVGVNRGHNAIDTIPEGDLGAHEPGTEPPEPLEIIRGSESELPQTVWVTYYDRDKDYQRGSQHWSRTVTSSQAKVTVELPIALTASEALHIAQWHMHFAWLERDRFIFFTTRKWSKLTPTDVVVVRGVNIRITNKTESPNGLIKFEGVRAFAGPFSPHEPIPGEIGGPPGSGQPPQTPPGAKVATELALLDIPMLADGDFERGYRVAMGPSADGSWPGAEAFKSSDGGTTYNSIAVAVAPDVIGVCTSTLGAFGGGNTFDESNVLTVSLTDDDATLTNYSEDAVLNGAGMYLVGLEIVQAKNAALTGVKTGRLSGLLRGRRGTEWAIATHGSSERFVALPVTDVDMTAGELFQLRLYKGVTFGSTLASAAAQSFADMGAAARCYSPVDVAGGTDASGNLTINWKRRTRIGGDWIGLSDVALGEAVEKYEVQIWDATYTNVARIIETTTPTASYSAADQVTDFGAAQQEVYISVGQVGAYQLGIQTRATIPGGGASINAVITPIPPYNAPPIPGGGGGGAVNSVMAWPFQQDTTSGYKIGDTWVAQFTTGASGPISGHIDASEFAEPAYARHSWLATDAAGLSVIAGTTQYGNSTSVIFSPSNVTTSTTYYFIVKTELSNGSPSGPLGSPAQMHITLVGAP